MIHIIEASPHHMATVRELFSEYAESLDFDLSFQGFEAELARLPGLYSPPRGRILLACEGATTVGCVAMQPLGSEVAEMKRLFVRPTYQGRGVGRTLTRALMDTAKHLGYLRIRLDTVPSMKAAIGMYSSMGFYSIPPYRENPIPGAAYLEKDLFEI